VRAVAADLNKLTVQMLINIIHYYYDSMPKGLSSMKKSDLVSEVANQIVISPNVTSSAEVGGKDDMDTQHPNLELCVLTKLDLL
jgi:hypothetical protein